MKEQVSNVVIEIGSLWRQRYGSPDPVWVRQVIGLGGGRRAVSFNATGEDRWRSCGATAFLRRYVRVESPPVETSEQLKAVLMSRLHAGLIYPTRPIDDARRRLLRLLIARRVGVTNRCACCEGAGCMHCRGTGRMTGHCEVCTPLGRVATARADREGT